MALVTLYPSLQAPVLDRTQTPEFPSFDKWGFAWSEPVRFKILPALAVAIAAASGQSFDPAPFPNVDPSKVVSTWFAPFTDPVRVPARLTTGAQQFQALVEAAPFTETILLSKWYVPFTDPVRVPPRLGPGLNQELAMVKAFPFDETAITAKWYIPWTDPVRTKPALITSAQRAEWYPVDTDIAVEGPTAWFAPFTDPVRQKPGLLAALQRAYESYEVPIPVFPPTQNYRLTVRNQIGRYVTPQGQAWTSPKNYPPVNLP